MTEETKSQEVIPFTIKWGVLLALGGALAFSLKPIFIKLVYDHGIDPDVLLAWRMIFALPIYLFVGWRSLARIAAPGKNGASIFARAALVGILGYYGASVLDLLGLQYISAQLERIILFLFPTFVCLFGWLFFSEHLSKRLLIALPLSYGGTVLIFSHDFQTVGDDAIRGGLLVLASALVFTAYLLFSKSCIKQLGSAVFTCIAMSAASIVILIHFSLRQPINALLVETEVLVLAFSLGVFATALPSFLISAAIARIGSSRTSVIGSVGPAATALLAVLVLGEPFSLYHLFGTLLSIGGIIYLSMENVRDKV